MNTDIPKIQEARKLIGEGKTKEALELISHSLLKLLSEKEFDEIKKTWVILKSEETSLRSQINRGLIGIEEQAKALNNINYRILNSLEELSNDIKKLAPDYDFGRLIEDSEIKNATERAETITQILQIFAKVGRFGVVREKGNLTSFSLPNRPKENLTWEDLRWENDEGRELVERLSLQRYWLEKHAVSQHCKLIVHLDEAMNYQTREHNLSRLRPLLAFIKTNLDKVDVVNATYPQGTSPQFENVLIVGSIKDLNYSLYARSQIASTSGIKNTYISSDPKKVKIEIDKFDAEFNRILKNSGMDVYEARDQVIQWIEGKITELQ